MQKISNLILVLFSIIVVGALTAKIVFADTVSPSYPSCTAPSGTVIANYLTGTHAIAGDPGLHTGADTVYELSGNSDLQCFCPDDNSGEGIQTNWWDIIGVSSDDIATFTTNGWINIANGSVWGLNNDPYLAQNNSYTCNGTPSVTPTTSVTPIPTEEIIPTATPSAEPTPTTEVVPTATPTPGSQSGGGSSNGSSSGGSSSGSSSTTSSSPASPSTLQTQVLGVNTFGSTGEFTNNLMNFVFGIGALLLCLSLKNYVQEKFLQKEN